VASYTKAYQVSGVNWTVSGGPMLWPLLLAIFTNFLQTMAVFFITNVVTNISV
jgi:hypothetical protein